jgi:hypothetical protein
MPRSLAQQRLCPSLTCLRNDLAGRCPPAAGLGPATGGHRAHEAAALGVPVGDPPLACRELPAGLGTARPQDQLKLLIICVNLNW